MDKDSILYYHSLFIIHTTAVSTHQARGAGFCWTSQEKQLFEAHPQARLSSGWRGERGATPAAGLSAERGREPACMCARVRACVPGSVRARAQ